MLGNSLAEDNWNFWFQTLATQWVNSSKIDNDVDCIHLNHDNHAVQEQILSFFDSFTSFCLDIKRRSFFVLSLIPSILQILIFPQEEHTVFHLLISKLLSLNSYCKLFLTVFIGFKILNKISINNGREGLENTIVSNQEREKQNESMDNYLPWTYNQCIALYKQSGNLKKW